MQEKPKVVILAGGLGTRLREETVTKPKPMVQVGDMPILWHIMKIYSAAGFNEFVICLGYKGQVIKEFFLNYDILSSDFTIHLGSKKVDLHRRSAEADWRVTLVDTGPDTMTGGRVKRIQPYVGNTFFLTYGDGVCDVDIRRLYKLHQEHGKVATVTAVRPSSRFGELDIQGSLVSHFSEKPQTSQGWINGGFFVLNAGIFDYLSDDSTVFEREPLERLAAAGELAAYQHSGYWRCVDTYRDLEALNADWQLPRAPWAVWRE